MRRKQHEVQGVRTEALACKDSESMAGTCQCEARWGVVSNKSFELRIGCPLAVPSSGPSEYQDFITGHTASRGRAGVLTLWEFKKSSVDFKGLGIFLHGADDPRLERWRRQVGVCLHHPTLHWGATRDSWVYLFHSLGRRRKRPPRGTKPILHGLPE